MAIKVDKPTRLGMAVVRNECGKCYSINTYRLSIKGSNLKVETIFVSASKNGAKLYKERTGDEFISDQAEQDRIQSGVNSRELSEGVHHGDGENNIQERTASKTPQDPTELSGVSDQTDQPQA